jgi:hypothetical protein
MHPVLRLYEDVLSSDENVAFQLPPLPRFIFVVHGSAAFGDETLDEGEAWQGESAITIKPGAAGVTCWRWELARGDHGSTTANAPGMITHEKLTAFLETLPKGELLKGPASAALSKVASASIRTAVRPHLARVARGMSPGLTPCSRRRPPRSPAASFA